MQEQETWDELNRLLDGFEPLSDEEVEQNNYETLVQSLQRTDKAKREAVRRNDALEQGESVHDVRVGLLTDELMHVDEEEDWYISGLFPAGGRIILGGFRKTGKSTLMLNLLKALAEGRLFLGLFEVRRARTDERVMYLNLELTDAMCRRWLRKMSFDPVSADSIVVVHARGSTRKFNILTNEGRDYFVRLLRDNQVKVLIIDPVAPLMAAAGLSAMADNEVSMFFMRMDEIASHAGVTEIVYVAHVGKGASAGMETVKGSTRWEDAVDAIWTTGRGEGKHTKRWFSAEVRGGEGSEIQESEVEFDPDTLSASIAMTFGKGRVASEIDALVEAVVAKVKEAPGIGKNDLTKGTAITGKTDRIGAAVDKAIRDGLIEVRRDGAKYRHYPL